MFDLAGFGSVRSQSVVSTLRVCQTSSRMLSPERERFRVGTTAKPASGPSAATSTALTLWHLNLRRATFAEVRESPRRAVVLGNNPVMF
jgi:hypothetical protein